MNPANAVLYVRAHDLAVSLGRVSGSGARLDAARAASLDLLVAVSEALTFPGDRAESLRAADRQVVRIRVLSRLAGDLGELSPGGSRSILTAVDEIGRMLGGWQKHRRRRGGELDGAPTA